MNISVIVPSRLAPNPTSEHGNLWLDRALMTVRRQTVFAAHAFEFIVGIDCDAPAPPARFGDVRFVRSRGNSQAMAVNAAAAEATGDVLVYAEDDDYQYERKLELQLPYLDSYDLVTCNSREIDEYANFLSVNDFPTGWVMKRSLWQEIGGFDESFKWHVDTEWLGRVNAAKKRRMHLVSDGRTPETSDWLKWVSRHSDIASTGEQEPLVGRLRNPKGGMARIASDPEAAAQSREEHERMVKTFGEIPW